MVLKIAKALHRFMICGLFTAGLSMAVLSVGCGDSSPIRIGFVGGLTGRVADLGLSGLDGATLAVEEINGQGGVAGRPIELVVRDDRQDPEAAAGAVKELIQEKVAAIVGHMTSAMSLIGAPIANQAGVVMISPTTSTNDLSGRDDYFFRIYPASADAAASLAGHAYTRRGYRRISVLYDQGNKAHTLGWYLNFRATFERLGGTIPLALPYVSGNVDDYSRLAEELSGSAPDAVFILANALDTAMVCQQFRKQGVRLPVLTSEWSSTPEVLKFGGTSVNGMEFLHTFDKESREPSYLAFVQRYKKRFGTIPGFASAHAYDCVRILKAALEKAGQADGIKQALLDIAAFDGIQGRLSFDPYGDIKRTYYLMGIDNGTFVRVDR